MRKCRPAGLPPCGSLRRSPCPAAGRVLPSGGILGATRQAAAVTRPTDGIVAQGRSDAGQSARIHRRLGRHHPRSDVRRPSLRAGRRDAQVRGRGARPQDDRPAQVDPGRRQLGDHRPPRQARRPAPLAVPRDARRAGAAPRDQLDELGGQQDLDVPVARGRAVPQGLRRDDVRGRQVHLRPRHRRRARGRRAREVHQHREHRDRRPLHGRLPPDPAGPAVPARRAQRLRRLRHEQEGDRGEGRGSDQHRSDRHRRLRARDRAHRSVAGRHARRQRRRTGTRRRSRRSCRSSTSPTRPRGRSRSCRATST